MIKEATATEWLKIAHAEWLVGCDYSSNLREPARNILDQMEEAIRRSDISTATKLMDMLRELSRCFSQEQPGSTWAHSYELAETLVECGRVSYVLGDKRRALHFFDESAQKYIGNDHCRAAVLWMLGCVQWQYSTKLKEAIVSWESSIKLFERLEEHSIRAELAIWYQSWRKRMRAALNSAMAGLELPPPLQVERPQWPGATDHTERAHKPQPNPVFVSSTGQKTQQSDMLHSFPVYASIPAGGFATSPITPTTYVEIKHVCIDGTDYYVQSLIEGGRINLLDKQSYVLVQVEGDSMNLVGIEHGDYVLLRVQSTANNGDIVAFEMKTTSGEWESTLKKYFKHNGSIVLQPQSRNPQHQALEFREGSIDFYIRGVAIAVFKKVS